MSLFSCLVDNDALPEHKTRIDILSPVSGVATTLDTLSNSLFSQRMFGEGVAIEVSGYQVFAPFDAKVIDFPATGHRIRLKNKHGVKLQIQCGMVSEFFYGEGFKRKVKSGQFVKQGQLLLEFDMRKLRQTLDATAFTVTVLNSDKLKGVLIKAGRITALEDTLLSLFV